MNGRKAREARQQARVSAPAVRASFWTSRKAGLVGLGVVAVVAASFVLPGVFNKKATSTGAEHAMAMGADAGAGLPLGSAVPSFSEQDLLTGKPISSKSVYSHKTLLFFSEGVMCQACFEQIQGLEQFGTQLKQRGIRLVSVTPDSAGELRQAARQYEI